MNQREKNALDRHITGNYGEDSVPNDEEPEGEKTIQQIIDEHNIPILAKAVANIKRIREKATPARLSIMGDFEKNGHLDPSCPGCQENYEHVKAHGYMAFAPSHKAMPHCQSGKHNHCTCDACF